MALPTNSAGPDAPTDSTAIDGTLGLGNDDQEIRNWLVALSPSGASAYDTGWLAITLNSGFTNGGGPAASFNRTGKRLELRGQISPASGTFPSAGIDVGTVSLPPAYEVVGTCAGPGTVTGKVRISSAGVVTVFGAGTTLTYARLDGLSWRAWN